jgi:hypothetical protein
LDGEVWRTRVTGRSFAFLTPGYDVKWSSVRFYAEMMERIRQIADRHDYPTVAAATIEELASDPSTVLVLDPAALILLAGQGSVDALLDRTYVLIIGEVVDAAGRSFVGWDAALSLRDMTLVPGGRLRAVIEGARQVTWQNEGVRRKVAEIRGDDRALFFPIDGYDETLLIADRPAGRDVDLLIYGAMSYPRRTGFVARLLSSPLLSDKRIVVAANVFDLNQLLARTKLVLHVNSVDDSEQVPYAKVMRPLANNIQVYAESTVELESSDLRPFVQTFAITEPEALFKRLRHALGDFAASQAAFAALDPRGWLARNYDFERNVSRLLSL